MDTTTFYQPPITLDQVLLYEVTSSWWAGLLPKGPLHDWATNYYAYKTLRKHRRYLRQVELIRKVLLKQALQG